MDNYFFTSSEDKDESVTYNGLKPASDIRKLDTLGLKKVDLLNLLVLHSFQL